MNLNEALKIYEKCTTVKGVNPFNHNCKYCPLYQNLYINPDHPEDITICGVMQDI